MNIQGKSSGDRIDGTYQNDTIDGGAGNDLLSGGSGNDQIMGGTGDDALWGEDGHDYLNGGAGTDYLFGGIGNDTLIGGVGGDVLVGGAGKDVLVYTNTNQSFAGIGNFDRVQDFEVGVDKIDLRQIDANTNKQGDQAFSLVGAFSGTAGELIIWSQDTTRGLTVYGDVDGDGYVDFVLSLSLSDTKNLLSASDFLL